MDEKTLSKVLDEHAKVLDKTVKENVEGIVGPLVAQKMSEVVNQLRVERSLFGQDRTGLSKEQKEAFAEFVKDVAFGNARAKANEALIVEDDSRGGYLVPTETFRGILRIAESFGLVANQARKFTMDGVNELEVPAYTGSVLSGEFLGVDSAGSVTALSFEHARLLKKTWQLAFVVNNKMFKYAAVDLADWLMVLAGEAMASTLDNQGLNGTGAPFVGVMQNADVSTVTMASTNTDFEDFALENASDMIAQIAESILPQCAFYFSPTVWAKIRTKKDGAGNYVFTQVGQSQPTGISMNPNGGTLVKAGEILGFPVYTSSKLPANSATAVSTEFGFFGALSVGLAIGTDGNMSLDEHRSGSFGGKEVALANQRGMVFKTDLATTVGLPAAFIKIKTAAS